MNRRGDMPSVPKPMKARDTVIERCRIAIDSAPKRKIRRALNLIVKCRNSVSEVGEGFQIGLSVRVPAGSRLGRFGYIGRGFYSASPICVGDLCMISTNVTIVANDHNPSDAEQPMRLAFTWGHRVTVFETDVWVGHGAILRSGITLGRGCVVAAGSVVTKDVEPFAIVGGNPAKVIRYRFAEDRRMQHDRFVNG
ncbi:hypothetical protein NCHU2750_11820 [Neorhizobium sp. NCHU2750]|nr:hypothetical protein NCHU2750_11820 [Neorhizobium sp. NCHU2750]